MNDMMKSKLDGASISEVEVQGISIHGIWLWVKEREYFLPFEEFPWFKKAPVESVFRVQLLRGHHLYWPDLDIDLELESIEFPEKYPLIDRLSPVSTNRNKHDK